MSTINLTEETIVVTFPTHFVDIAPNYSNDSKGWAITVEDTEFTDSQGTAGYSSLHYAAKSEDSKITAESASATAETASTTAVSASATAVSAKTAAETAETDSYNWAMRAEDSQYTDSDSNTGYSAYHWAQKADAAVNIGAHASNHVDGTDDIQSATATQKGLATAAQIAKLNGLPSDANNYVHPIYDGDDINLDTTALTGAVVISDLDFNITTDNQGHVTDANAAINTRSITAADISAASLSNNTFTGQQLYNASVVYKVNAEDASISCNAGNYFTDTVSGNTSYTFNSVPAGFYIMTLELTNGGDYTITWPSNVKWPAGTAPTLTASGVDVLTFCTNDAGSTWRGMLSMGASA